MNTLNYIVNKFNINPKEIKSPYEIPNYGRDNLAELFHELDFKVGVEIGVEQGAFSEVLLKANPQATIYSVDPWKAYRGYRDHVSQEKLDGFFSTATKRLSVYPGSKIIRKFGNDALLDFKDESLDFVYIDGNHNYESVVSDIALWSKKIRPGGIISGHDYKQFRKQCYNHVVEAVCGYTASWRIHPWFVLGRKLAPEGEVRDQARSFMWVK